MTIFTLYFTLDNRMNKGIFVLFWNVYLENDEKINFNLAKKCTAGFICKHCHRVTFSQCLYHSNSLFDWRLTHSRLQYKSLKIYFAIILFDKYIQTHNRIAWTESFRKLNSTDIHVHCSSTLETESRQKCQINLLNWEQFLKAFCN